MNKYKHVHPEAIIFGAREELSKLAKNEFALAYGSFKFVEELAVGEILRPKFYKLRVADICTSTLRDGKYEHTFSIRNDAGQLENRRFYYSRTQVEYLIKFGRYLKYQTLINHSTCMVTDDELAVAFKELSEALERFQNSIPKKDVNNSKGE